MEPRPEGRGEVSPAEPIGMTLEASMEPRPEGRGELLSISVSPLPQKASMEPRPEGRGESRSSAIDAHISPLQWSHVPKDVEIVLRADRYNALAVCFNGATSRRTWREGLDILSRQIHLVASMEPRPEGRGELHLWQAQPIGNSELQWSHVPKDVESRAARRWSYLRRHASMEPRPEGRGEELRRSR